MNFNRLTVIIALSLNTNLLFAATDNTQLAVWANEAIIATYTYNYQDFLEQQKKIAKFFTAAGWIAYSTALQKSGLPEQIKQQAWRTSAVATMPPAITAMNATNWKADMPVLVVYQNDKTVQKQVLKISMTFTASPKGIRGFAITSVNAEPVDEPCKCDLSLIETNEAP